MIIRNEQSLPEDLWHMIDDAPKSYKRHLARAVRGYVALIRDLDGLRQAAEDFDLCLLRERLMACMAAGISTSVVAEAPPDATCVRVLSETIYRTFNEILDRREWENLERQVGEVLDGIDGGQ